MWDHFRSHRSFVQVLNAILICVRIGRTLVGLVLWVFLALQDGKTDGVQGHLPAWRKHC